MGYVVIVTGCTANVTVFLVRFEGVPLDGIFTAICAVHVVVEKHDVALPRYVLPVVTVMRCAALFAEFAFIVETEVVICTTENQTAFANVKVVVNVVGVGDKCAGRFVVVIFYAANGANLVGIDVIVVITEFAAVRTIWRRTSNPVQLGIGIYNREYVFVFDVTASLAGFAVGCPIVSAPRRVATPFAPKTVTVLIVIAEVLYELVIVVVTNFAANVAVNSVISEDVLQPR